MQIHCPSCAATYSLPVILLTTARTMRCAVCAHDWQTEAVDPETARVALLQETQSTLPAKLEPAPEAGSETGDAPVLDPAARERGHDLPEPTPEASIGAANGAANGAGPDIPFDAGLPQPATEVASGTDGRPPRLSGLRANGMVLLGWALSFTVLFVSGRIVIANRADLVAAWPNSRRLFLWLGLT